MDKNSDFSCGDRVIIFPYNGIPHGYTEYVAVPELNYLIRVPQSLPLSVAAMLPTGNKKYLIKNVYSRNNDIKIINISFVD